MKLLLGMWMQICADSVPDDKERKHLLERLSKTREVCTYVKEVLFWNHFCLNRFLMRRTLFMASWYAFFVPSSSASCDLVTNFLGLWPLRHQVITIDYDQMEKFCGNVLEVENDKGLPVLALSTQVWENVLVIRNCFRFVLTSSCWFYAIWLVDWHWTPHAWVVSLELRWDQ